MGEELQEIDDSEVAEDGAGQSGLSEHAHANFREASLAMQSEANRETAQ